MSNETRKSKIPAVRVASDDCAIMQGRVIRDGAIVYAGEPVHVHQGEWVEIVPVQSMREFLALTRLVGIAPDGVPNAQRIAQLQAPLEELCDVLSRRIVAWNWTDLMGEPLPAPYGQPDVIKLLSDDEILWLVTAAQGETGGQRKNVSMP